MTAPQPWPWPETINALLVAPTCRRALLDDDLDKRLDLLRTTLPIVHVAGPTGIATHIMASTAPITATYDTDGGQPGPA
jgi:hypothetical protein